MFGWGDPGLPVVLGLLKLRALARRQPLVLSKGALDGDDPSAAFKRFRRAYFKEAGGFVETPCYDGAKIAPGHVIAGPAIVEEATTTVVIPPGCEAVVDAFDNYLVGVGGAASGRAAGGPTTAEPEGGRP